MKRSNVLRRIGTAVKAFGFKQWFLLAVNIVLVLASVGCAIGLNAVGNTLGDLTAAGRFQGMGETRFAQLACYLPVDDGKTEEDIYAFRRSLDSALVEQSLEAPEGGRLYIDAYYGAAPVTVSTENGAAEVKAVGAGGDFFYFHPMALRGGSYIKGSDLMDDLVVLDEEMAWRLYGGTDLAGLPVYINGEAFVISGVIARDRDFATDQAYTGSGGVFMSFSAMRRLIETASITGYEIVMPDPVTGYAKGTVTDAFPIGEGDVVENSSRYGLPHLLEVMRGFGLRSMRTNGVVYPYWENAARLTEDYAAALLVLAVLFALCPLAFAAVLAVREIRRAYRFAKVKIPEKVEAAVEKKREERLEKSYAKDQSQGDESGGK